MPELWLAVSARPPVVEEIHEPVSRTTVVTPHRREGLPPWAIPVMAVAGIVLLFVLFFLIRGSSDDSNVNVAINANRRQAEANRDIRTTSVPPADAQPVQPQTVPGSQVSIPNEPSTSAPSTQTVPGTTSAAPVMPDKGTVAIRAKVVTSRGSQQPARGAKFYLLDKDIETILRDARVEPIEGNTMSASLGLAAVHPDQYGEFQRAANACHRRPRQVLRHHRRVRRRKALRHLAKRLLPLCHNTRGQRLRIWDSPISINPGENLLDLSPASVTEIES
jgi:hypothetical protein